MRVLVACEFSGRVRDAFTRRGHQAWSCDMEHSETRGKHLHGDVREWLKTFPTSFDLMIAFPPCTYLCNSGVRWLHEQPGRWELMREGAAFFKELLEANIEKIAVENPVMHKHARQEIGVPYTQIIHPWQFGHGETKATCLWLKGLPPLEPTEVVEGRENRVHREGPGRLAGGDPRWKRRSRTLPGIAEAMAEQWGRE